MPGGPPVRVVRIISRLNVGGPAIQAITLTRELEPLGYRTTLIRGREGPDEGSMDHLARQLGVQPVRVPGLRRDPGVHDLRALGGLVLALRRARPQIVHTHMAKAGTLGRLASLVAAPSAVRVHTFHGHSLSGYFPPRRNRLLVAVERFLARRTDRLLAVSEEIRDELVELGVAPADHFEVVPLGFDLRPFALDGAQRAQRRERVRRELGIPMDARLVTLVARLVPIKRVDRFLRVAGAVSADPRVRFLIVGDGELGDELRSSSPARALGGRLAWAGLRRDMPDVYFASDVVALTSDNEGTPVSLIEARAAGLPVVSTAVGGVRDVVGGTGAHARVAEPGDERALAQGVRELLADLPAATAAARSSRGEVVGRYSLDGLVGRIGAIYRELLPARVTTPRGAETPRA